MISAALESGQDTSGTSSRASPATTKKVEALVVHASCSGASTSSGFG